MAFHYSHHFSECRNVEQTYKFSSDQPNAQLPNGQKNWPILVINYDTGTDRTNVMGVSLRNDKYWVRVSSKKEKNDNYRAFV